jgi:hypothetical protein
MPYGFKGNLIVVFHSPGTESPLESKNKTNTKIRILVLQCLVDCGHVKNYTSALEVTVFRLCFGY